MGISINSSLASLQSNRQIDKQSSAQRKDSEQLSSGLRINKASDDSAGLAIAMDLLANADTSSVAARNISDGVSLAVVADSTLGTVSDIVTRMKELAVQSSTSTVSDADRAQLNSEFVALRSELDRISESTEFNGQKLLASDSTVTIQAGTSGSGSGQVDMSLPGVNSAALGLASDISTQNGAKQALDETTNAIQSVAGARGEIGSGVSRLETAFENIRTAELNSRDAAGRIRDADIAEVASSLVRTQVLQQASVAVHAQANSAPALALKLLQ